MGIFDWFKKKKKTIEEVPIEEMEVTETKPVEPPKPAHIQVANLSNNTLLVMLASGELLSRFNADRELYEKVIYSTTEQEVRQLMAPELTRGEENAKKQEEDKKKAEEKVIEQKQNTIKKAIKSLSILEESGIFELKGNKDSVYMKGIDRSLPALLAEKFAELLGQKKLYSVELEALKRFWLWCCLNPYPQVADELYSFLEANNKCLRLNKQGFFYALRNVVPVNVNKKDKELVKFVSETYTHVKAVWKKKGDNYDVLQDKAGAYKFVKTGKTSGGGINPDDKLIGNLGELYRKLPEMEGNRYTDNYTKTFDIRVGKKVAIAPEKCDWSAVSCGSGGLHFTLDQINHVGCGEETLLILINPAKVVGLGRDGVKGRTYEYLPVMVLPKAKANLMLRDKDFDTLQLDEWYAEEELIALKEAAEGKVVKEDTPYVFNLKGVDKEIVKEATKSLQEIKEELTTRVKKIA